MMDLTTVQTYAALISITIGGITIIGFLIGLWRQTRKITTRFAIFLDDWEGTDARPGRDATPGVMERLNRIDGELKHNSGSTMKDAVKRIETKLDRIEERIEKGDARFIEGNERFDIIEQRLDRIEGN